MSEKPRCEFCGHVFNDGEKAWVRLHSGRRTRKRRRGCPANVGYDPTVFRCERCYQSIWH